MPQLVDELRLLLKRHGPVLQAWLIYILCVEVFTLITLIGRRQLFEIPLMALIARVTGWTVGLFGVPVQVAEQIVASPGFTMEIVPACTGLWPTFLFLAGVIAYPCRWKEKGVGFAVGVAGIFAVNILRTSSLFFIGLYTPAIFEQAHMVVWQPLVIFSAVALWLFWVIKLTQPVSLTREV